MSIRFIQTLRSNQRQVVLTLTVLLLIAFNLYFLINIYAYEKKNLVRNLNEGLSNTVGAFKRYRPANINDTGSIQQPLGSFSLGSGNLLYNGSFEIEQAIPNTSYKELPLTLSNFTWHEKGWYKIARNALEYTGNWQGEARGKKGNFLLLDGATIPHAVVWEQEVTLTPYTSYLFQLHVSTLSFNQNQAGLENHWQLAKLQVSINDEVIGIITAPQQVNTWLPCRFAWRSKEKKKVQIRIINLNTNAMYNDFGLDDLGLYAVKDSVSPIILPEYQTPLPFSQLTTIDSSVFVSMLQNEMHYWGLDVPYRIQFSNRNVPLGSNDTSINKNLKYYETFYLDKNNTICSSFYYINPAGSVRIMINDYSLYLYRKILPYLLGIVALSLVALLLLFIIYRYSRKEKQIARLRYDLINNITHELKTPVSTILAAMEGLHKFRLLENKAKTDEYIEITRFQAMKLNHLIDHALTLSIVNEENFKLDLKDISIGPLLEKLTSDYRSTYPRFDFSLEVQPGLPTIRADVFHLTNIINALVDNAIKYSGKHKTVEMSCHQEENEILISVKDRGIGIPEKYRQLVFEKFFRVPDNDVQNTKGHGLGLSYVKTITTLHKGRIKVSSNGEEGTTIQIILKP